jgi:hypothetical protein
MKRTGLVWFGVVAALPLSAAAVDTVPAAFQVYYNYVTCAAKLSSKMDPKPECKPANVKIEVAVELADEFRQDAVASINSFSPVNKKAAEDKLKELAETLRRVKEKLKPKPAPETTPGTTLPPTPTSPPKPVIRLRLVDGGSKAHGREMPTLYVWTDGTAGSYYLRTGRDDLVEIQPRLYRAFLRDQLGVPRAPVPGELPTEMVRDDLQQLFEKLHAADAKSLKKFGERFPVREGSSLMRYLQETTDPNDAAMLKTLEEARTSIEQKSKLRKLQYEQHPLLEDFDLYDRKATKTEWLKDAQPKDPWLIRDLLRDNDVDLKVRGADGKEFTVPVRSGRRLDVSDRDELRIDGVRFKPEQLKELKAHKASDR